jgi:hypothetical protein
MSAEPEGVPAVEGDRAETCPTCGGPCTTTISDLPTSHLTPNPTPIYESLVKGEVVAEATLDEEDLEEWNQSPWKGKVLRLWRKGTLCAGDISVLVIRAGRKEKEDSMDKIEGVYKGGSC